MTMEEAVARLSRAKVKLSVMYVTYASLCQDKAQVSEYEHSEGCRRMLSHGA